MTLLFKIVTFLPSYQSSWYYWLPLLTQKTSELHSQWIYPPRDPLPRSWPEKVVFRVNVTACVYNVIGSESTPLFFFCNCREEYIDFGPVKRIRPDYPINEISSFLGGPLWVSASTSLNVRKETVAGVETSYFMHYIWRGKKPRNPAVLGKTSQQNRRRRKCTCQRFVFNLLKPTGHVTHQQFNIQQLYALPTLYLCVLCLSENKQRLVSLTT
jgi:hypothetical protein